MLLGQRAVAAVDRPPRAIVDTAAKPSETGRGGTATNGSVYCVPRRESGVVGSGNCSTGGWEFDETSTEPTRTIYSANGRLAEWFKALVLKTSEGLRSP
jgi:hypothetical protein